MKKGLFLSIDSIINQAEETLNDDEPIGPFDEAQEGIDEIQFIETDFSALNHLQSLLLYCDDIIKKIPNACKHTLFHNVYKDLKKKVADYEAFAQKYEENSNKILTSKQCIKYSRWLSSQISLLERELQIEY